jgi:glyoxylase-like metal-dependent hydrolase (beta-lactamase superfamily II)
MRVTGTAQLEAWRRRELPPAEEVASGVWSVPVPVPDNPVRYVLCYLIEHRSGVVMVDPGWNHPDAWRALTAGLDQFGIPLSSVTAVLVTHVHPDHHGLSGTVREESGAWIGMHEREDRLIARISAAEGSWRPSEWAEFLHWCGAPAEHVRDLTTARNARPRAMVRADRTVGHGELIDLPGLRLRALLTPGHTAGHLCFHDEDRGLLLTGDHVLPRITPNVSAYDMVSSPLQDYLQSLDALRGLQPAEVLPAHEYRFADLDDRLGAIADHHAQRLKEVEEVLISSASGLTTWQAAERVTWSRGWDQLSGFPRQAALGEVIAHLRHLQSRGAASCADAGDGVGLWRPAKAEGAGQPPQGPV